MKMNQIKVGMLVLVLQPDTGRQPSVTGFALVTSLLVDYGGCYVERIDGSPWRERLMRIPVSRHHIVAADDGIAALYGIDMKED